MNKNKESKIWQCHQEENDFYSPSTRLFWENYAKLCHIFSSEINFGNLNTNFWKLRHFKRQSCSYSWVLSECCVDSNMKGVLSLRGSCYGDAGLTGSISQPRTWHQGAEQCETGDEPQITKLSAWILCGCSFPMGMPSKYYNNQLWPKRHVMPEALMTQDWIVALKLEPWT